jgi:hypothetical protein
VRELAQALVPHAPMGSVGRGIGEAIGAGLSLSGSYPRVSHSPSNPDGIDSARTILQSDAVSQSGGKRDGGTTPGWSQHKNRAAKSSAMLIGMLAAFVGGTIVLSGGAYLFLRSRGEAPTATAAAQTAAPPPAPTPPPPPAIDPPPLPTAAPVESATTAPKPAVTAKRPAATATSAAKPLVAPTPAPPPKPAGTNPLLL